jgi:hypothetical protein
MSIGVQIYDDDVKAQLGYWSPSISAEQAGSIARTFALLLTYVLQSPDANALEALVKN